MSLLEIPRIFPSIKNRIADYIERFNQISSEKSRVPIILTGTWGVGKSTILNQIKLNVVLNKGALILKITKDTKTISKQLRSNLEYLSILDEAANSATNPFEVSSLAFNKQLLLSNVLEKEIHALSELLLFPVIFVIDQWDMLPPEHPLYDIGVRDDSGNKYPLYIVAGSGSWNPYKLEVRCRFSEFSKKYGDRVYVQIRPLEAEEMILVQAKNPDLVKMSTDELFEATQGILRLINACVYLDKIEALLAVDKELNDSVNKVLGRALKENSSLETTIKQFSRIIVSDEENLAINETICRISGILDENNQYTHPRFKSTIRKLLFNDTTIGILINCLKTLGMNPQENRGTLGNLFESVFGYQAQTLRSLKIQCHLPCKSGRRKANSSGMYSKTVGESEINLTWNSVSILDTSSDLSNYNNSRNILIKLSGGFPLIDYVLSRQTNTTIEIFAIQVTIQSYEDHKKTEEWFDEMALQNKKFGTKRTNSGKVISAYGMVNQTVEERLKQIFGVDGIVYYVFISPNQQHLLEKNCFYIATNSYFSQSGPVKDFLEASGILI